MMSAMTMTAGNSADDGDHGDDGDNSKAPGVVDRRAVDEAPCHRWCQRVKVLEATVGLSVAVAKIAITLAWLRRTWLRGELLLVCSC